MTESAYASEEHTRTTLKGPTAAACGCCVCGWRAHIRASARAGRYERRRARRSRAACHNTHARGTALSASTIDNPPRLCACRSIVCASAPVGQRQRRLHGVRCEGRPAAAQNLARATKQLTTEGCAYPISEQSIRYWPSGVCILLLASSTLHGARFDLLPDASAPSAAVPCACEEADAMPQSTARAHNRPDSSSR